ncbi:hypothetical protein HRbin21_01402 [bacterium HR21]|nr:hypothetical protein HRbin21_01402 [bacterium HR21]
MRSLCLVFLGASALSCAQFLQPGEELEYEVSYFGISLGRIRIVTERMDSLQGKPVVVAAAVMESHPNIPFLSLKALFRSWLDTSGAFSHRFEGWMQQGDRPEGYGKYVFDYDRRVLVAEEWEGGQRIIQRTFPLRARMNEGLSLLFAARRFVHSKKSYRFPTVVTSDTAATVIHFTGRRQAITIGALPYPVRTVYFWGTANWTGIYGLTGSFEGWFSDDEARVPIRAKLRVYIGSVTVELVRWKRAGWQPPRASNTETP